MLIRATDRWPSGTLTAAPFFCVTWLNGLSLLTRPQALTGTFVVHATARQTPADHAVELSVTMAWATRASRTRTAARAEAQAALHEGAEQWRCMAGRDRDD